MVSSKAATVPEYLASLPPDRRAALSAVRTVIRKNLPPGFKEGMQLGMISYHVPLSTYPDTYNGQPLCLAALAAQKQHMAVYLMTVYGDPATQTWFAAEFDRAGKKLDMGKSCVRFRRLDDLPLDVIGAVIARTSVEQLVATYEASRVRTPKKSTAARTSTTATAASRRLRS